MRFRPLPALCSAHAALLICLGYALLALLYAAATPPFEAPDEGAHFLYMHNLNRTGQLPVLEDRATVFASRSVQRHHPPLYYTVGALLIAPTTRADVDDLLVRNPFGAIGFVTPNNHHVYLHRLHPRGDTAIAVWIARLYSLALSTATLWLIYRAGETAFPGRPVGLAAMGLAASIPGFLAAGAAINNDTLVTLLFAAGVAGCLRLWRRGVIERGDVLVFSLILPAAALAKLTGLALLPLVYGAVVLGALRRRYPWRQAAVFIGVTLLAVAALAGPWYLRNLQLYGDPLALAATRRIWGRGPTLSEGLDEVLVEANGIWESFWMVLGHLSLRGPGWLFPYALAICGVALIGLAWLAVRRRLRAPDVDALLLLGVTVGGVVTALILATRQINISQGRILYPALVGLAPLLALGWRGLLGRRLGALPALPLTLLALAVPFTVLRPAYAPLETAAALSPDARPLVASAETLHLAGYTLHTVEAAPGDLVTLDVYFSGRHADNPALFVKALDPLTQTPLGGVDLYPGMAPTDDLDPDALYRARVVFRLDPTAAGPPQRLDLAFGWRVPDPERFLPWRDPAGAEVGLVAGPGPLVLDPTYRPPPPDTSADLVYGGLIGLEGYTLPGSAASGTTLPVALHWEALARPDRDYTLTLGLVDAAGTVVAQADGMPPGLPTSAWPAGLMVVDARTLSLPADLAPGEYRVFVGWYTAPDGPRLDAEGEGVRDDLFYLPAPVRVE